MPQEFSSREYYKFIRIPANSLFFIGGLAVITVLNRSIIGLPGNTVFSLLIIGLICLGSAFGLLKNYLWGRKLALAFIVITGLFIVRFIAYLLFLALNPGIRSSLVDSIRELSASMQLDSEQLSSINSTSIIFSILLVIFFALLFTALFTLPLRQLLNKRVARFFIENSKKSSILDSIPDSIMPLFLLIIFTVINTLYMVLELFISQNSGRNAPTGYLILLIILAAILSSISFYYLLNKNNMTIFFQAGASLTYFWAIRTWLASQEQIEGMNLSLDLLTKMTSYDNTVRLIIILAYLYWIYISITKKEQSTSKIDHDEGPGTGNIEGDD